jgi:hypothetical protein
MNGNVAPVITRKSTTDRSDVRLTPREIARDIPMMLICDRTMIAPLIKQRQDFDFDGKDEVWDGVYVVSPLADDEHQDVVTGLSAVIFIVVRWAGLGQAFAGVNVSDRK